MPESFSKVDYKSHMPSYCVENVEMDNKEARTVAESWSYCMSGNSSTFLEAKKKDPSLTPLAFFSTTFYGHLFEMAPEVKPLFKKSVSAQGKMLASMIRNVVTNLEEKNKATFVKALRGMAIGHNRMGIKADGYAIVGLNLLHTVQACMGDKFTEDLKTAWIRVYSRMMHVVIPVVVANITEDDKEEPAVCPHAGAEAKEKTDSETETKSPACPHKAMVSLPEKYKSAMPSYCVADDVTGNEEAKAVAASWKYCMSGEANTFIEAKKKDDTLTPLSFFSNTFYGHLFEMAPQVQPLFKRARGLQGKMLASMVKNVVANLEEKNKANFVASLRALAIGHNKMGIKADGYAIVGLNLLHTVQTCMGDKFTEELKTSWIRVYSRMMHVIIPIVVDNITEETVEGVDSLSLKCPHASQQ